MDKINRVLVGTICLTVSALGYTALTEKQANGLTPVQSISIKGGSK